MGSIKEKLFKNAPVILVTGEIIVCFLTFSLDEYFNYNQILVWAPFATIQILIGLACGLLLKKMYGQIHTDVLTGLCNRKYFYKKLSELLSSFPISLIMIDLDNFKMINDTHGHIAGDHVLQQFAEILQQYTRKNDIICRWGGEEFAVIFPKTELNEAFKIADRIRSIVENHVFVYNDVSCKITVSIGIAATKEGIRTDVKEFIKIADDALYKAKEKKNSIVIT